MAELINLNRVRKARARADRAAKADANAAKFGRTKGERLRDRKSAEMEARKLDAHRRDNGEDGDT